MTTLPTLSLLLSSQEARNAAPCVAINGPWCLYRNGYLLPKGATKQHAISAGNPEWDIIWSGDLPALLAAMVAENEATRMHPPTEADQDGHPYWVCWTDSVGTWYDKARWEDGQWRIDASDWSITPDRVMRLPMGGDT